MLYDEGSVEEIRLSHMNFSHIQFSIDSGIGLVTIHRPEKLNALNAAVMVDLRTVFEHAAGNPEVKGLIVTGSGEKAFVAGADIRELAEIDPPRAEILSSQGQATLRLLETMRKPSVAAINGFALGGGMELAMACTARIASTNAKMGQPEVKLGIVPGYGATQRLPRLVGRGKAIELLISGEMIDAAEAHRIGLVNHVVEASNLLSFAKEWLKKVLANGPLAVALTIQAVETGYDAGLEAGLRFEAMAFGFSAATEDRREGTRAFLEKRPAVFTGR
jgi:enoyl-CoA hydratase